MTERTQLPAMRPPGAYPSIFDGAPAASYPTHCTFWQDPISRAVLAGRRRGPDEIVESVECDHLEHARQVAIIIDDSGVSALDALLISKASWR